MIQFIRHLALILLLRKAALKYIEQVSVFYNLLNLTLAGFCPTQCKVLLHEMP